jgi:hypothetical protein
VKNLLATFSPLLIAINALLIVSAPSARAAEFSWYKDPQGDGVLVLSGPIVAGDTLKMLNIMKLSLQNQDVYMNAIRLNTGGGDVDEGFSLAEVVRKFKLASVVPANSYCASACFLIFAAGREKWVGSNAKVGVHSARDAKTGVMDPDADAATVRMARYVNQLGVPPLIAGRMVTTTADGMAWLTPVELESMGAHLTGYQTSTQQTEPLPQAQDEESIKWRNYFRWAVQTAKQQNDGVSTATKSCNNTGRCVISQPYYELSGRYAIAVEVQESGQTVQRAVCRRTYPTDTYQVCTDWVTEKNVAYIKSRGQWVMR